MTEHNLDFARIIIHNRNLAEIIVNQGVLMNLAQVDQYHSFLREHLGASFNLLINKLNSYSYTPEAQREIGTIREIDKMAIVTYNKISELATQNLNAQPRSRNWKFKSFRTKEAALLWLLAAN